MKEQALKNSSRYAKAMRAIAAILILVLSSKALGQITLFYPDWYEDPTFFVANNYSSSSCIAVENNDLQAAKDAALQATRQDISAYLNGLPSENSGSSVIAARGVYLSDSARVLDQDAGKEFFCVLGSIPYSRIEETMKTGLTQTELELALKNLRPALDLAAKGIISDATEAPDLYRNALAYIETDDIASAGAILAELITKGSEHWDVHQSFIQLATLPNMSGVVRETYAKTIREPADAAVVAAAHALVISNKRYDLFDRPIEGYDLFERLIGIVELSPQCRLCHALMVTELRGTATIDNARRASISALEQLGGVAALESDFLTLKGFREFRQQLEIEIGTLQVLSSYDLRKLDWSTRTDYPQGIEVRIGTNMENMSAIYWRVPGHIDVKSTGPYPGLGKQKNILTGAEYALPNPVFILPGSLAKGEYQLEISYMDMLDREIGPFQVTILKDWDPIEPEFSVPWSVENYCPRPELPNSADEWSRLDDKQFSAACAQAGVHVQCLNDVYYEASTMGPGALGDIVGNYKLRWLQQGGIVAGNARRKFEDELRGIIYDQARHRRLRCSLPN